LLRQFLCKGGEIVSTLSTTDLARLIQGYRLYAKTEGILDLTAEARAEMEQHRRQIEEREASKPRQLKIAFIGN